MRLRRRLQRLDRRAYARVTRLGAPALDGYAPKFVQATDHMAPWVMVSATLAATGGPRLRRAAARAILAAAAANAGSSVIKHLVRRRRPDSSAVPAARVPYRSYSSSSFPSGHTAAATGFALGISTDSPPSLTVPVLALAGAVGFSRVHSGVHYPGDVLAGMAVGAASALLARMVLPPLDEEEPGAETSSTETVDVDPEGEGVTVVLNPHAADGTLSVLSPDAETEIADRLPRARIVHVDPDEDLPEILDRAASDCAVLAVAGGDGTINAGATAALAHDRPLLVLPTGTLNNFAQTLGTPSPATALDAYAGGRLARVDVGEVDGNIFLNTSSFGSYPRMVERRDRWAKRVGKWPAFVLALTWDLWEVRPTPVLIDGRPARVWWAFVGNCRYRTRARVPVHRERLDDGALDVRLLCARRPFPRIRALSEILAGPLTVGGDYVERTDRTLALEIPSSPRLIAVDGEILEGARVMSFRKRPAALRVFVPDGPRPSVPQSPSSRRARTSPRPR
ncbi:phosphatase PAP2 family protein [Nocardiopsis alba]|uniref:phosphatase PAP2 family protein n=1 Tax=Nocardiopsis alba TaxID=53437 RepID=UPI00340068F7